MLAVGRDRADKIFKGTERNLIGFVEGNAEVLPFADNSFDLYTIAFGLRNVTNKDVIPKVGELIAGDAESYQYLVESIRRFPKQ
eukprot:gene36294-48869_t